MTIKKKRNGNYSIELDRSELLNVEFAMRASYFKAIELSNSESARNEINAANHWIYKSMQYDKLYNLIREITI